MVVRWCGLGPPNIEINYIGPLIWYVHWRTMKVEETIEMIHMRHIVMLPPHLNGINEEWGMKKMIVLNKPRGGVNWFSKQNELLKPELQKLLLY